VSCRERAPESSRYEFPGSAVPEFESERGLWQIDKSYRKWDAAENKSQREKECGQDKRRRSVSRDKLRSVLQASSVPEQEGNGNGSIRQGLCDNFDMVSQSSSGRDLV